MKKKPDLFDALFESKLSKPSPPKKRKFRRTSKLFRPSAAEIRRVEAVRKGPDGRPRF